ncbi:SPOR domain-containing protein [Parasedimentitalea maritima]|uniref:SPOR domain-containing protein n=1 Tax=Parasedimentitalea maritima TaxID=2578117 RepID=A0ABY2USE3_9RHOB|nr:SPOR domain-containing protein [Zongyanglinia marina]
MKITRVIALSIVTGAIGVPAAQAQSGTPSEFPPASYKGKQYVDSKGCVFIRAGIDGNVTWVPRVNRSRKQLCGQQPTVVAGTTSAPTQSGPAPEQITIPASQRPATPTATPTRTNPPAAVASTTAPTAPAPTKPQRPTTTTTRVQSAPVQTAPAPAKPAPQPVAAAPVARTTAPAAQTQGGCSNASALSQQYTNKGARCGPQAESPITYGNGSGISPQSSLQLTPNTRIVPTHVYQDRRHSQNLDAPEGFRTVWTDDRLNLRRAERGLKPAVVSGTVEVPQGYVLAGRDDDRLNTQRGLRTAAGDVQTDMIWTRTVPRTLVALPLDRPVITLPASTARSRAEAEEDLVLRLSTRSAPETEVATPSEMPKRYVRAATFADPAVARETAQSLAAEGLPVRLGSVTRRGQAYRVVLAGPFQGEAAANRALVQVRASGYSGARISR